MLIRRLTIHRQGWMQFLQSVAMEVIMLTQDSPEQIRKVGAQAEAVMPQAAAARSLTRIFGLEIRSAVLTVIVDLLVFAADTFSMETLLPLGIAVAAALGFIVYKIQRKWYDDDHESALIKAMIIALMTVSVQSKASGRVSGRG